MDSNLSLEFLRVVEQAAIACAHTMGQGDRHKSDQVAVEAMRQVMDTVPIDGTIVIGEGERDEAPMLYIGEKVGRPHAKGGDPRPTHVAEVDIAVDPLEGTNLCATGAANAIAVLAAFASISADPGARATARLTVPSRLFQHFDESSHAWVPDPGTYTLRAGRSSRDLELNATVMVR